MYFCLDSCVLLCTVHWCAGVTELGLNRPSQNDTSFTIDWGFVLEISTSGILGQNPLQHDQDKAVKENKIDIELNWWMTNDLGKVIYVYYNVMLID